MSSAKSARTRFSADMREQLIEAASLVCETSFFAYAEAAEPEMVMAVAGETAWYHAEVSFDGLSKGRIQLSLPEGLARDLFAAFLGFADASAANDAETEDVIGEFTNMVCGTWLTTLGCDTCFTLAHPIVRLGGLPAPEEDNIVLSVNGRPTVLRAEFE